jgi:hypothetical protein
LLTTYKQKGQEQDSLVLSEMYPQRFGDLTSDDSSTAGIIDFDGKSISKFSTDKYGHGFVTSGDKFFRTFLSSSDQFYLDGFDKTGNSLSGFPIEIQKELGKDYLGYYIFPQIIDDSRIAVLTMHYNLGTFQEGYEAIQDLAVLLDIYSISDGTLIKRVKLFDGSSSFIQMESVRMIAGDLNNDGVLELVVSFGLGNLDLFYTNYLDVNAYTSFFYVLNQEGEITSSNLINGHLMQKLVLADLEGTKELNAIAVLSGTWSTENYEKIISFDYNADFKLDVSVDSTFEWIQGLIVGDVNSDNMQEIIINYRPRWFGSGSSGFKIFNKEGVLQKKITIPTLGRGDDYRMFDPIITYFNNDGKIDIIQQSSFITDKGEDRTRLYAFTLDYSSSSSNLDWPMFMHDPQHTGAYCTPQTCSELGKNCGTTDDGCGNILTCGNACIVTGDSCEIVVVNPNYDEEYCNEGAENHCNMVTEGIYNANGNCVETTTPVVPTPTPIPVPTPSVTAVNGGWSTNVYGACDEECGGGHMMIRKYCNNPLPVNGGTNCVADTYRNEFCSEYYSVCIPFTNLCVGTIFCKTKSIENVAWTMGTEGGISYEELPQNAEDYDGLNICNTQSCGRGDR